MNTASTLVADHQLDGAGAAAAVSADIALGLLVFLVPERAGAGFGRQVGVKGLLIP